MAEAYREQVKKELKEICKDVLKVIVKHLLPASATGEKIFYYKMKGDYHRYMDGFTTQVGKKKLRCTSVSTSVSNKVRVLYLTEMYFCMYFCIYFCI